MKKKFFWRMADIMLANIMMLGIMTASLVITSMTTGVEPDNFAEILLAVAIMLITAGVTAIVALDHNRKS